ncbi:hypothetical protein GCM10025867_49740 (plasmid) [Frondihabitans sucicola]|uniref:Uncharacterized protein n=1 Tax=Frondihabitans sucicola TaxID=1268041 RepID=A0ABN6YB24_9MICO|nr:hypothetical protein [Frondihabitans sucicola]BDZ52733.1 hypothetical protein GCM10025867_49740 [Frondihabitans sucicola]
MYDDFTPAERASMIATRPPDHLQPRVTPHGVHANRSILVFVLVAALILAGSIAYPATSPLLLGLFAAVGYFAWWRHRDGTERIQARIAKGWARRVRLYVATITERPEADFVAMFDAPPSRDHVIHDGSNFTFHAVDSLPEGDRHLWVVVDHGGDVEVIERLIEREVMKPRPMLRLPEIVEMTIDKPGRVYQPTIRAIPVDEAAPAEVFALA